MMSPIGTYHSVSVPSGAVVHYISAGENTAPTILLLHGFPTSSNQYRHLIPILADKYHVLAPDLPGFGFTTTPRNYQHTFANMASVIGEWLDVLTVKEFAVYVFDYGAPTGFRLALQRPHGIKVIISQNGNAYDEGIGPFFDGLRGWWDTGNPNDEFRQAARGIFPAEVKREYIDGTPVDRLDRIDPTTWTLDYMLNIKDKEDVQLDLFWDYQTNVILYPKFQAWLRAERVPVLAVWGKNDTCFVPAGAEAFKKDTEATVVLLDGGHFLLETHLEEVASVVKEFLGSIKY